VIACIRAKHVGEFAWFVVFLFPGRAGMNNDIAPIFEGKMALKMNSVVERSHCGGMREG
jgi:hypothetical protein